MRADGTQISSDWTFQGVPVVRLENHLLRIDVLPTLGGKIWSIEHRPSGREFLWHNPRQRLRSLPVGANYDDHFVGGFDELLPNDLSERVQGESLVDHGELWTTRLEPRIKGQGVTLTGQLPITPLSYAKSLRLEGNRLILEYSLQNVGRRPLDLLWKLHPALQVSPGAEIVVPATTARAADPSWSRIKHDEEFNWGNSPDLHVVPPMNGSTEFLYLLDLKEGECALRHRDEGWSFRMKFPKEIFRSVWVFASFGGWRDLEVLILEPCTTPTLSLAESAAARTCLHVEPHAEVNAKVEIEVSADFRATD